jgi:exopolysaccharide production protein ExoZ
LKTFLSIQYLRAAAAMSVVLFHAFQCVNDGFPLGAAGVDVFFVISGFVLWTSVEAQPTAPLSFLWRRIGRVVPLYWVVTLALAVLALAAPAAIPQLKFGWRHVALSLAFIQHSDPVGDPFPFLPVGWTLNYEMIFYLVMTAALMAPARWRLRALAGGLCAVTVIGFFNPPLYPMFANPMLLQFVAGAWIGSAWRRRALPGAHVGVGLMLAGLGLFAFFQGLDMAGLGGWKLDLWRPILWGIPAFAIVAGAVSLEADWGLPRIGPLKALGDGSYSLYLCHWPTIALVAKVVPTTQPLIFLPIAVAAAVTVGLACRRWVERPLLAWFQGLGRAAAVVEA